MPQALEGQSSLDVQTHNSKLQEQWATQNDGDEMVFHVDDDDDGNGYIS